MSDQQPKIEFSHVNPTDERAYFPDDLAVSVPESIEQVPPSVHVTVEQSRSSNFLRRAKVAGAFGLAGAVGIAGMQIKNWFDSLGNPFNPESSHSVELTIEAPETDVYENVYLNLASFESSFSVSLDTSLDRKGILGFSNCDTQTRHTGEDGEDDRITSSTNAGIEIDSLTVTRADDQITAEVSGDLTMTLARVDYEKNKINVRGATGGFDACVGTNEITWARNIIDITIQKATGVAASCAMQDEVGREVFEDGIKRFIANTDLVDGLGAEEIENMDIAIDNYSVSADAMYGNKTQEFRRAIDTVVTQYMNETEDGSHKDPVINDRALMDCAAHKINLPGQRASQ